MIDIHCHILPNADDGAETMDESLSMIRAAAESGVTAIIATPHSNLPAVPEKHYVSYALRDRFVDLCLAVRNAGIPVEILPGAEILCTPDLPELLREKQLLPLAGTRYLLAEFFFDEPLSYLDHMLGVIRAFGLIPVIAHPERYDAVQATPGCVESWLDAGCVIQLNKGSILGELGHRAEFTSHWLLRRNLVHLAASDAHGAVRRTTPLDELNRCLSRMYSPDLANTLLDHNPQRLLQNLPLLQTAAYP